MIKEELRKYQDLKRKSEIILGIYEDLKSRKEKMSTNSGLSDMPKTSNKRLLDDVIAELDSKAWKYHRTYLRALKQLSVTEEFIESLEEPLHQNILRLKYIEGLTWRDLAQELDYNERQVRRIHGEILERLANISKSRGTKLIIEK